MQNKFLKVLSVAAIIGALSASPASAWGRYGWGGGYRHGGYWGVPLAAGLLGGLAIGAIASQPYYGYGYGYGPAYYPGYEGYGCYFARQPVVDGWGNVMGFRRVRVCR